MNIYPINFSIKITHRIKKHVIYKKMKTCNTFLTTMPKVTPAEFSNSLKAKLRKVALTRSPDHILLTSVS